MLDLLYIDAEAYFQIVSILFQKGKVFEFIKHQIEDSGLPRINHLQILERFAQVCQSQPEQDHEIPDDIRLQYLFFVANVPSRSNIHKD